MHWTVEIFYTILRGSQKKTFVANQCTYDIHVAHQCNTCGAQMQNLCDTDIPNGKHYKASSSLPQCPKCSYMAQRVSIAGAARDKLDGHALLPERDWCGGKKRYIARKKRPRMYLLDLFFLDIVNTIHKTQEKQTFQECTSWEKIILDQWEVSRDHTF